MNRFQILKGLKPPEYKIQKPSSSSWVGSSSPWVGKHIFFNFRDRQTIQGLICDVVAVSDGTGCYLKVFMELPERLPVYDYPVPLLFTIEDYPGSAYMLENFEFFKDTNIYRGNVINTLSYKNL